MGPSLPPRAPAALRSVSARPVADIMASLREAERRRGQFLAGMVDADSDVAALRALLLDFDARDAAGSGEGVALPLMDDDVVAPTDSTTQIAHADGVNDIDDIHDCAIKREWVPLPRGALPALGLDGLGPTEADFRAFFRTPVPPDEAMFEGLLSPPDFVSESGREHVLLEGGVTRLRMRRMDGE